MKSSLSDQKVRYGGAVPHSVVVRQVPLKSERTFEDVVWSFRQPQAVVQSISQHIVVGG